VAIFTYDAINAQGLESSGVIHAPDLSNAREQLQARGLLPASVPHADAAFTAGRSALLVAALTGSPEALVAATEDRLHQQYRMPAMPQSAELVADLRVAGLAAVISGAGPTVLVLARDDREVERLAALTPEAWECWVLAVDTSGAHVVASAR